MPHIAIPLVKGPTHIPTRLAPSSKGFVLSRPMNSRACSSTRFRTDGPAPHTQPFKKALTASCGQPRSPFKLLPNLSSTCATNAAVQCLLATGKAFGGRGPISSLLRRISLADPTEDLLPVLVSLVDGLALSPMQFQGVADVWDSLCDRLASEDGTWEELHGTILTRFQCLSCGHTRFKSERAWLWEIPLTKGAGTVSEGCSMALKVTQNTASNEPGRKDGLSCDICRVRSEIVDFRSDSTVQVQWVCGDLLFVRGNWCSADLPSAVLDSQVSPRLTLSGCSYDLFLTICNVADGTHYVCVILKDGSRWKLDDALPPVAASGWCAGGVPEILVYRRTQHTPSAHPVTPPPAPATEVCSPPLSCTKDVFIAQVNALVFTDATPKGGEPSVRLKTPETVAEWNHLTERIKLLLPATLYSPNDNPVISCALITDAIRDILPEQPPPTRRRPSPKPRHIQTAGDLKSRLRGLRRQATRLGAAPVPVPNLEFTDSLHLYNHYVRTARAQERFAGLSPAMKKFHGNPAKFAKEILSGAKTSGAQQIKVTASEAEEFFKATYADARNDRMEDPPPGTVPPPPISTPFNQQPISMSELRRLLKKKSNQCAPGPDGIPYTVYKHSESLQRALVTLFNDVVRTGRVPPSWSVASIVLIPKSGGVTDDVKELRPIALTNTMGKLFTAILARRLEAFLRANGSWDISQKGFASATQGCIDHSFTLQQALHDARTRQTNISVAWLDLKNAFGSISHKMVQYALRQYGVPLKWCQVVFGLYDSLCARVVTSTWTTNFFPYHRGVFQGDPLSPIIFNMAFSPVIAQIKAINMSPYVTKHGASVGLTAYADDLAVVTRSPEHLQRILDRIAPLLSWMRLAFNAKKCVGLVLHRGALATPPPSFFIGRTPFATLSEDESFKFLGVHIPATGSHTLIFDKVAAAAKEWWEAITAANISIPAKLWVFKFSLTRLRWYLAIYDWPLSAVERLQSLANSFLRCWLHLPQAANLYVVFSPRALQVPLITSVFKAAQVSKHRSLRDNRDPDIQLLHAHRFVDNRANWFVEPAMTAIDTFIAAEDFTAMMLGKANRGHAGLGFRPAGVPFQDARSRRVSRFVAEEECEERLRDVLLLPTYKDLWSAIETDMVQDRHWQRALLGLSDKLLSFALKAATNCLPTNSNLAIWRKMGPSNCPLCGKLQSPGHVFNCCLPALNQGRYNFRHDLVLGVFISACAAANPGLAFHYCLDYMSDTMAYSFPFPVQTILRPDVVVTSEDGSSVWLVELTVPLPHRVSISNAKKADRYRKLALNVSAATGRTVNVIAWEVTSYGNVAHSTRRALLTLGLSKSQARSVMVSLAQAAILGSYTIFQYRNAPIMPPQPLHDLLPPLPSPAVNAVDRPRTPSAIAEIVFVRGLHAVLPPADSNIAVLLPNADPLGTPEGLPQPLPSPAEASWAGAAHTFLPVQGQKLCCSLSHLSSAPNIPPSSAEPIYNDPPSVLQSGKGWEKVTDSNGGPSFFRCLLCSARPPSAVAAGQHARRCRECLPNADTSLQRSCRGKRSHQANSESPGVDDSTDERLYSKVARLDLEPTNNKAPLPPRLRSGNGWVEEVATNGPSFFRCLLCSARPPTAVAAGQHARRCRERQHSRKRPSCPPI